MADEAKYDEALIYFKSKSQLLDLGYSKRQIRNAGWLENGVLRIKDYILQRSAFS